MSDACQVIMHRLCHLALTEIALASSDVVFTAGAATSWTLRYCVAFGVKTGHEGKQMLFVKHGELECASSVIQPEAAGLL